MVGFNLFGYRIGKDEQEKAKEEAKIPSFAPPAQDDGSVTVAAGGAFGTFIDMDGSAKNEAALITKYRSLGLQAESEIAIDDIVNEAIIRDERKPPVRLILDDLEFSAGVKKKVEAEFKQILKLMDFNTQAYDIFKKWYVDGRIYYHKMIDIDNPSEGIQELRYIDPRKIRKIRQEVKNKQGIPGGQVEVNRKVNEFFLYNPRGLTSTHEGLKIAKDSIAYVHSGILDEKSHMIHSYVHKALKPMNQLRMLEDAQVIYRIARAPERRIFYIDVGNLPKMKAEQYLRDMMVKHKNKLVYDANDGTIRDDRKHMTMLEDFWLPRREGGKGTEITTLPGGQNLGEMDDIEYFKRKLYKALHVPISRLENDSSFNLGRASEISRDELKFTKFIVRLRNRFTMLFDDVLKTQLLLKGIIAEEDWIDIKDQTYYDFQEDNHFTELKNQEVLRERFSILNDADQFVGRYYPLEWIKKNILQQTEEEIKVMAAMMKKDEAEGDDEGDDNFGAFVGRADVPVEPVPDEASMDQPRPGVKSGPKKDTSPKKPSIAADGNSSPAKKKVAGEEQAFANTQDALLITDELI